MKQVNQHAFYLLQACKYFHLLHVRPGKAIQQSIHRLVDFRQQVVPLPGEYILPRFVYLHRVGRSQHFTKKTANRFPIPLGGSPRTIVQQALPCLVHRVEQSLRRGIYAGKAGDRVGYRIGQGLIRILRWSGILSGPQAFSEQFPRLPS